MSAEKIKAEARTEFGKGAARRIRRDDKVPAVIYGHGNEPVHVTLHGHTMMLALKKGGTNALVELDLDGELHLALAKEVQRDPIKGFLEHIDFVAVVRGEKVTVDVGIHVTGDAQRETLVVTENTTVQIEAEATHIPDAIELSIEGAAAGTQFTAADLTLPKGSTLVTDGETLIVNVTQAQTTEQVEAELEEAEAEAGIEKDDKDEDKADETPAEGTDSE